MRDEASGVTSKRLMYSEKQARFRSTPKLYIISHEEVNLAPGHWQALLILIDMSLIQWNQG